MGRERNQVKVYKKNNVLEESLERIRLMYREQKNIVVGISGGKDSTIVLELTIRVAKELNRLPVKVYFLDQESEFQATIDYMRRIKNRKSEIDLHWYQMPFLLSNSTSMEKIFLDVWGESNKHLWIHEREEDSIHENNLGVTRFFDVIDRLSYDVCKEQYMGFIGLRAQESRKRFMNMCKTPIYKNIGWISKSYTPKGIEPCFRCYPIYDWQTSDVWKYIGENNLDYNRIYDKMQRIGIAPFSARVSSVIHEMGVHSLETLQEVEPETYEKLTQRVPGISSYNQVHRELYKVNHKVMGERFFSSKHEYLVYVIELLVPEDKKKYFHQAILDTTYYIKKYGGELSELFDYLLSSIILNDWELEKYDHKIVAMRTIKGAKNAKKYTRVSGEQRQVGID